MSVRRGARLGCALRPLVVAVLLGLAGVAHAQAPATAPAPAAAASAPASPAKKALIKKVLQLQQPGIESIARSLIEQPAAAILQQVGRTLQTSVPEDKRDAVGREAQNDVRKFVDDVTPQIKKRAVELAPSTIGPLLDERFSEDELKQLAAWLDSPVSKKYQQLGGDLQHALSEPLIRDSRALVEPKMRALEETLMKRLGVADGAKPAAKPAAAASAQAKK
jgi:hypothetical protein